MFCAEQLPEQAAGIGPARRPGMRFQVFSCSTLTGQSGRPGRLPPADRGATTGRRVPVLLLALGLLTARPLHADELGVLLRSAHPAGRFTDHVPHFTISPREFTFQEVTGPQRRQLWVIQDADRYVGLYNPESSELDLISLSPTDAPRRLSLPTRYHRGTRLGTCVQTLPHADGWPAAGARHHFDFRTDGTTVTLTEVRNWNAERHALAHQIVTLRCDPVAGYALDMTCQFSTNDPGTRYADLISIFPARIANPWPDRWQYDRFLYTPGASARLSGWWNNPVTAALTGGAHQAFSVRNGGYIAWVSDAWGWGLALTRRSQKRLAFSNVTGGVWLEQHTRVALPDTPDVSGIYFVRALFHLQRVPPEAASAMLRQAEMLPFDGKRCVMVRLGGLEAFDDQPLPLTTNVRGVWSPELQLTEEEAHSGKKSLKVLARPREKTSGQENFLLPAPQIPLEAGGRYRLEAWVKVVGANTEGFVSADLYADDLRLAERVKRQKTSSVQSGEGWKQVRLEFEADASGPYLDLRFVALGTGTAYFDDVLLKKLPSPAPRTPPSVSPRKARPPRG